MSYSGPKGERGQLLIGPNPKEPGRFRDTHDIQDALTKFVQLTLNAGKEEKDGVSTGESKETIKGGWGPRKFSDVLKG